MWVLSVFIARFPAPLPGPIRPFFLAPQPRHHHLPIRSSTAGAGSAVEDDVGLEDVPRRLALERKEKTGNKAQDDGKPHGETIWLDPK